MPPQKKLKLSEATETYISADKKLSLPNFLKMLGAGGLSVQDSMLIAGKIFKTYNTPAQLAELTSVQLIQLKVDDKEHRRLVLSAVNKAGYIQRPKPLSAEAGSSSDLIKVTSLQKRKRDDDLNEDLPDGPTSEGARYGNMDFEEILDEELLKSKRCVVNRTPVMAAWATVVAERLGFKREEALSIGSVYAGVGAGSKDMPKSGAKRAGKATVGGSAQPYVELMGRRM
ncbi:hypothetical protein BOTBODRAFT_26689 [Botryobasidium botryosum FD-172 SS1]|uniref:Uncharacterized protein n=1 Tax=Botryobasidium botryosum (strain FD-172 SS1) TaxID=930990 RepID=A0A067MYI3_BOTB1|nr:hypothetical protein BOTBODRAFT_26689 [Botryobasidium botryosum FD-172 SS1]